MKTSEILKAARQKIERPESWTKYSSARDVEGELVSCELPEAVSFCALGAVGAVTGLVSSTYKTARDALIKALPARRNAAGVSAFNDAFYTSHCDVLGLFGRAIALAEEREGA